MLLGRSHFSVVDSRQNRMSGSYEHGRAHRIHMDLKEQETERETECELADARLTTRCLDAGVDLLYGHREAN